LKRNDIHFGQVLLLKGLKNTENIYGYENILQKWIGTYVQVKKYDEYYQSIVIVKMENGNQYSIDAEDLIDPLNIEENGEKLIIKVNSEINVTFDEDQLFL